MIKLGLLLLGIYLCLKWVTKNADDEHNNWSLAIGILFLILGAII